MFLSYWLMLALPILVFPTVSHRHLGQVYAREKNGIAADNAAILLGSGDTAWLTALTRANSQLEKADRLHHGWHACRLVPATAAECVAVDVAWENALRLRHVAAGAEAQTAWQRARFRALAEIARLGARAVSVHRLPLAPIAPRVCPVCHLPVGWRVVGPVESALANHNAEETFTVGAEKKTGEESYDYEIR